MSATLTVVDDQQRPDSPDPHRPILLGRVSGVFGVRGEIKIESWTEPRLAIFRYQPWTLARGASLSPLDGVRGRNHGQGSVVASVPGIDDRDRAQELVGSEISVPRSALPPPKAGEYYWVDLEGMSVQTVDGIALGTVSHLFDTGANHVLVVQGDRERLIPFAQPQYVTDVDFDTRRMVVDWDPEF